MKSKNHKYKSKKRISDRKIKKNRKRKSKSKSQKKSQKKSPIKNNYKKLTHIGKKWVKQMERYMKLIED